MSLPLLFYSNSFLEHKTDGHPESPERLKAILKCLDENNILSQLEKREPRPLQTDWITRLHTPQYLNTLESFCKSAGNGQRIDEDTVVSKGSWPAALKAAGASIEMIQALFEENYQTTFSLVRPPGHHAMPDHTMGFCLFNNIALAAQYAIETYGIQRIMILDWDAHHGNATEHMFYDNPKVLTVSWHQDPNWPGTGPIEDIGKGAGKGYNVNIPLPVEFGDAAYLQTFKEIISPLAQSYQPELILVSAGYDAHHIDILTQMGLTSQGFAQMTEETMKLADIYCQGKVGFLLEGGYHLGALSHAVTSTIQTLIKEATQAIKEPFKAPIFEWDSQQLNQIINKIKNIQPLLSESKP